MEFVTEVGRGLLSRGVADEEVGERRAVLTVGRDGDQVRLAASSKSLVDEAGGSIDRCDATVPGDEHQGNCRSLV